MAKQILEVDVPDGKKAIIENGKLIFKDINQIEKIKTIKDAVEFLSNSHICSDILDTLSKLPEESFEYKVASYRAVVTALTYNIKRYLTIGERYFPIIEFCYSNKLKNCNGNTVIGKIKSNGEEFNVVGGYTDAGTPGGLGLFDSFLGATKPCVFASFLSVPSKEVAEYISKQFGKLLFEVIYGGVNCDWEWIE